MDIISEKIAAEAGYRSVTTDVNPKTEKEILTSMDRTMGPTGAVWIRQANGHLQAGRKRAEIRQGDGETSE
jgi:hypothetical protein